jgi:hypothetical protein
MIIAVLDKQGANTYLCGPSGKNYMELEKVLDNGYNLKYSIFIHPVYKQGYPGFESNLSAIDLLFNIGPVSNQIVKSSGNIENYLRNNINTGDFECKLTKGNEKILWR